MSSALRSKRGECYPGPDHKDVLFPDYVCIAGHQKESVAHHEKYTSQFISTNVYAAATEKNDQPVRSEDL